MPSMTAMMSTMRLDEALIWFMVCTTCATAAPPRCATSDAPPASWRAWSAFSLFCRTVDVSSIIEAAVSSSELACSSVREDRSILPLAISAEAMAMASVPVRTRPTMAARLPLIAFRARSRSPISSRLPSATTARKSPAATCWAMPTAAPSGSVMLRISHHTVTLPTTRVTNTVASMTMLALRCAAASCSFICAIRLCDCLPMAATMASIWRVGSRSMPLTSASTTWALSARAPSNFCRAAR
ncbi:hypothetical protein D3C85_1054730 [compost metagenome]